MFLSRILSCFVDIVKSDVWFPVKFNSYVICKKMGVVEHTPTGSSAGNEAARTAARSEDRAADRSAVRGSEARSSI